MADGNATEEEFDFLSTVKTLLDIQDSSLDRVLLVYIPMMKQTILNYCNIRELPPALNYVLCQMVADTYNDMKSRNKMGAVSGGISSITEDGRTVSFSNSSSTSTFKTAAEDRVSHTVELNRFKKLYRL